MHPDPVQRGGPSFSRRNRLARLGWKICCALFFRPSPRPFHAWRAFLLRLWNARIGEDAHIYSRAVIWAPWNLQCGARACLADDVEVYNVAQISLGEDAVVSQGAFLCAASHDYEHPGFRLIAKPIRVGDRAWIAARALVLPGVTVGDDCVIGAGSVVTKDMPAKSVCAGNPCRVVKTRA